MGTRIFVDRSRFRCALVSRVTIVARTFENVVGMVISRTVFSKAENVIGRAADIERMRYIEEITIWSGQRTSIDSRLLHFGTAWRELVIYSTKEVACNA